jgi:hypothetical protein
MQLHLVSKKKLAGILLIGLVFVLGFVLGIRSGRNTQGPKLRNCAKKDTGSFPRYSITRNCRKRRREI